MRQIEILRERIENLRAEETKTIPGQQQLEAAIKIIQGLIQQLEAEGQR